MKKPTIEDFKKLQASVDSLVEKNKVTSKIKNSFIIGASSILGKVLAGVIVIALGIFALNHWVFNPISDKIDSVASTPGKMVDSVSRSASNLGCRIKWSCKMKDGEQVITANIEEAPTDQAENNTKSSWIPNWIFKDKDDAESEEALKSVTELETIDDSSKVLDSVGSDSVSEKSMSIPGNKEEKFIDKLKFWRGKTKTE